MNWLIALTCVVGGWAAHGWLDKLRSNRAARRARKRVMASQGWIDCGLEAFGFPPDGLTVAAQAAINAARMVQPPEPQKPAVPQVPTHYCPLCENDPAPGNSEQWMCAMHLMEIKRPRAVIDNMAVIYAGPQRPADMN